jgi:lipopolysaccharide assembly outer membrane protein LptD (OstA)
MIFLLLVQLSPFSADTVEILRDSNIVHLIGNVKIESDSVRINCREARLYETEGTFILERDVTIRDSNGTITADRAQYQFRKKLGRLWGNVTLDSGNEVIRADSLDYDANRRFVKMIDNVRIEDTKNGMNAFGREGWFDLGQDRGRLAGQPHLEIAREGRSPMNVRAREFSLDVKADRFSGFDSVVALIDSITIRADTFDYDLKKEDGRLAGPQVTEKENILSGKRGVFKLVKKAIDLFSVEEGESIYYTKEGSKNYVAGSALTILFKNGQAYKIIVNGSPHGYLVNRKEDIDAGN